jgi:Domain of Unknown Function (DUF1259)
MKIPFLSAHHAKDTKVPFSFFASLAVMLAITLFPAHAQQTKKQDHKPAQSRQENWKQIDDLLGRRGEQESPGVWKYSLTRDDLHVTVNGQEIKPELALDGWITFQQTAGKARMMGELVLTPAEIDAVIGTLQDGGIQQMALHNHLAGESPQVMYLHIRAQGDATAIAQTLKSALAHTRTPAHEEESKEKVEGIDAEQIHRIIGGDQETGGGVLELEVKRRDKVTEGALPIPPAMEVSSEAKFQPLGNGQAVIYGELILLASEVNPVLKTLRQNGIPVMALHNHMLAEQPRVFFIHCLAKGDAIKLAHVIRAALDKTNAEKAGAK